MSATHNAALFEPLELGSVKLSNKITMSALTRNRAPDTIPTDIMREYYVQRAKGGAGLIVTEGILIARQGTEWEAAPGIWDRELHLEGWKKIVDAVHAEGTKIYAQLWHLGRVSHTDAPQQKLAGEPVWGPSAIAARGGNFRFLNNAGYITPTEIPDPAKFVELFRNAAEIAKEAGFDGVELHTANGYLPMQFLDSTSNKRTDQWGGSVENRARFVLEIIKAAKTVFPNDTAIKLSPCGGYNDVGMPLDETIETYRYVIAEGEKLGLSYIALSRYNPIFDPEIDGKKRATEHDVLATFRPYIKTSKLILNGSVLPEEGAQLISSGTINAISVGFNYITHPDFAKRAQHGKPFDNIPDFPHLQLGEGGDLSVGYTTYPAAVYA